jgi:hypothetical protein
LGEISPFWLLLVALGYFLNNQYSPFVEAWALKFSYDVDILVFFGHFFSKIW